MLANPKRDGSEDEDPDSRKGTFITGQIENNETGIAAGGLYGHFKMTITPTGFDFTKSIEIVVMVILGGMGNTLGVILAAILLTLLPEVLRPIAEYRMIIYSLLLIVLMILRPQGLFNFKLGKAKS